MKTFLLNHISQNPLVSFTILLLVVLTLPPLFEKLRLPGLVGLLFAGVIFGQDGLNLLNPDSESIKLLSDIGKIYLMFVAGLEIDLNDFRRTKNRSLGFGLATFLLPMITGILVGKVFNFSWNSSVLMGSLLASHTLLSYPIVQRLGIVKNEAVTVTIGATILTDIASLLVLAVCVSIHQGLFTLSQLIIQLIIVGIYFLVVLLGVSRLGKSYFRRAGNEESNQFLFILLVVFLASVGAQVINVDKIVGAFLAGLAVNDVVGNGPVEEKIEFVGGTLFIPFFFVSMGLLIDLPAFAATIQNYFPLMIAIVSGLIISKFLAAYGIKFLYHYNFNEVLTMWSLSMPQVAATLAAALAAYESVNPQGEHLITEPVFNSVIVLMLVTSLLGPILTNKFARYLAVPQTQIIVEETPTLVKSEEWLLNEEQSSFSPFKVVIPIYNPHTQRYLIEMASFMFGD
jgi:Kef-type K+ transport system membrane component KefB